MAEVSTGVQNGPGDGVGGCGESGYFDVVANGGGVLSLNLSVQVAVGGTGFTGTVILAQPANGLWDIVHESAPGSLGTVIASSANPNGWKVEPDHSQIGGAWITVPAAAAVGVSYEARCQHSGSGFFDVLNSTTTAPAILPLTATSTTIVGGNSPTGTATLDAPAPTGCATATLESSAVLTTYVNGQQKDKKRVHLIFHRSCPNFLGLTTDIDGGMDDHTTPPQKPYEDQIYLDNLNAAMRTFERNYGGGFRHKITMAASPSSADVA